MSTLEFGLQRRDVSAVKRVKAWAEAALALPEGQSVFVTELRCTEEGCPPIETVIVVVGAGHAGDAAGKLQAKIGCPASDVQQAQVEAACAALRTGAAGACDHHESGFTD